LYSTFVAVFAGAGGWIAGQGRGPIIAQMFGAMQGYKIYKLYKFIIGRVGREAREVYSAGRFDQRSTAVGLPRWLACLRPTMDRRDWEAQMAFA
jgi:hypothetical protein